LQKRKISAITPSTDDEKLSESSCKKARETPELPYITNSLSATYSPVLMKPLLEDKYKTITSMLFGALIDDCTAKIQEKYKELEGCLQELIWRKNFQTPLNTLRLIHGNFEAISLDNSQYLYPCYSIASSNEISSCSKFCLKSRKMPSDKALCNECHGEQEADRKREESKRNTEEQSSNRVRLCNMSPDGAKKYALQL
jgi:hypothetical protein